MSKIKCICEQDPVVIFRNCFESIDFSCNFVVVVCSFYGFELNRGIN